MTQVKQITDNEIHLLIKYTKSVLWRGAKHLSYIEDARCLKVNTESGIVTPCKWASCAPDSHLQGMTTPNAVLIKFDPLMMSSTLPETCRGL